MKKEEKIIKWRIISTSKFRNNIYVQITNDIDIINYVSEKELSKYNLELKKEVKK